MLKIGVLKEPEPDKRVSLTPEGAAYFVKNNCQILVEAGAGQQATYPDSQYETAGAGIHSRNEVMEQSDVLLSINRPEEQDMQKAGETAVWIGVYQPLFHPEVMQEWAKKGRSVFSLDSLPRTSRAQSMDVLSSQANIAGYKAILLAATIYPRYFPMFMTAAGSIPPAKVLILGAGVAGLQAVATARRLGAVVSVFDTRPAVKEQVMSLGATFVDVEGAADASKAGGYAVEQSADFQRLQKEKISAFALKSDIIVTTAQIPGKTAPILITKEMIEEMKAGSVIIDIASATGGNTEYTRDGERVRINGVTIIGAATLPSDMPADASKMYSKNVQNFLKLMVDKEGALHLNFEDDLIKGCCITHGGKVVNERIQARL